MDLLQYNVETGSARDEKNLDFSCYGYCGQLLCSPASLVGINLSETGFDHILQWVGLTVRVNFVRYQIFPTIKKFINSSNFGEAPLQEQFWIIYFPKSEVLFNAAGRSWIRRFQIVLVGWFILNLPFSIVQALYCA